MLSKLSRASVMTSIFLIAAGAQAQSLKVIPQGTQINVTTLALIDAHSAVGSQAPCQVSSDVVVDDAVVVRAGELAFCRIDEVRGRQIFGEPGQLALSIIGTRATDGQMIPLTGTFAKSGVSRHKLSWNLSLIFWPAGLIPGGKAQLPAGTIIPALVSQDVSVSLR